MTAVAGKAEDAADALLAWTVRQPARSTTPVVETIADAGPATGEVDRDATQAWPDPAALAMGTLISQQSDRRVGPAIGEIATAMRLPTPDWLHHKLVVSGTATDVGQLRQAAAGAGIIPWHLDLDRMEEDYFHLLAAAEQRSLSVSGARIFARQLREAVARRHDLAISRVGQSRTCSFDLHALIPVPPEILTLGPDEPQARAWLWEHWGTTEALRHVAQHASVPADASNGDAAEATFCLSFWSADWTPWRALKDLDLRWPALRFDIRPSYDLP